MGIAACVCWQRVEPGHRARCCERARSATLLVASLCVRAVSGMDWAIGLVRGEALAAWLADCAKADVGRPTALSVTKVLVPGCCTQAQGMDTSGSSLVKRRTCARVGQRARVRAVMHLRMRQTCACCCLRPISSDCMRKARASPARTQCGCTSAHLSTWRPWRSGNSALTPSGPAACGCWRRRRLDAGGGKQHAV